MKKKVSIAIICAVALICALLITFAIIKSNNNNDDNSGRPKKTTESVTSNKPSSTTAPTLQPSNCEHNNPDKIIVLDAKNPTCQETGLTEGKQCTNCGTILVPQNIIGTVECNESDWVIDLDPTFTEDGSKHTYCTVCNTVIRTESIDKIDITTIPITITFTHTMGMDNRQVLDAAIARFNAMYPNITIEHTSYGDYDSLYDYIRTRLMAGVQPNITFGYTDHIAYYLQTNKVVALDSFINDMGVLSATGEQIGFTQAQIDDFIPGFLDEGRSYGDGVMYSLPFLKSTEVLYYDKTTFDSLGIAAPQTWDEVEMAIRILKQAYPNSTPLGWDSESNLFITLAQQYNAPYTSSTGENYLFVNDTNKSFVARFAEWYQKGWMTTQELMGSYTSDSFGKANDEYGKIFMSICSSPSARYMRPEKIDGSYPFEVGVVAVPQVDANNPKTIHLGPSICIFDDENDAEVYASWLFVKFLMTDAEFQAQYSMKTGYLPVINSVLELSTYATYLNNADGGDNIVALALKTSLEQQNAYFSTPTFRGSATAREEVGYLVQSVFSKYVLGADNSNMIDREFQTYYENCMN